MSVYEKAYDSFKEAGFKTYVPNTHKGDVMEQYIVLLDGGRTRTNNFSSQTVLLDVLCYVPGNRFTDLDILADEVKNVAKNKLFPLLIPTGNETQAYYDDSINGWMKSVEYRYTVRNRSLR